MDGSSMDNKWIGKRTIRPDGADKVTGRATFGADFNLPGMLWGKVLRSPHPHAKIISINLEKAKAAPGVKSVICSDDMVEFPLDTPVMVGPADMRFVSRNILATATKCCMRRRRLWLLLRRRRLKMRRTLWR